MSVDNCPSLLEGGVIKKLYKVVEAVASWAVIAMVVLVVVEVLMRSTTGFSFGYVDELVSFLVVTVTFFGVCVTFMHQSLFKVEFFYKNLPEKGRKALDLFHSLLSLGLCFILIRYAFFLISSSYRRGTVSQSKLEIPLYLPQLLIPIGLIVLSIFILYFVYKRFTAKPTSSVEETS
ncbi:MAG: TRAP transporter small permease subunit [Desulfuromonadales bacterium]|nr:TRAP transporter small permease subunit [Desulfuromonadales bacterium]MBN2792025.1 TRAP transporter small permease subunit [Desulfuromonadales bacterium]